MPSDTLSPADPGERTTRALEATAELRERYRAGAAAAAEQIRAWLDARRARSGDVAAATLAELGAFARGRVDAARFAALLGGPPALAPELAAAAERVEATLRALLARGDALFACDVPPGGDLRHAARDALEEAGRAFGAALAFQAVKAGVYRAEQHDALLDAFPFSRWNRAERLLAPPLVVTLDGADLHAEALAEFLDGRQKLVLVVRGASTPAPLVRLVTPGTFVAQVAGADELARALAYDGPAVAALVPETAARFVHDPAAGPTLRERLVVPRLPAETPRAALGRRSASQQRDELAQLAQLAMLAELTKAAAPVPAPVAPVAPAAPDVPAGAASQSVDALTDWLLAQAGFAADGVRQP